jgi:ABC-2 type transport system ATP-binding protein
VGTYALETRELAKTYVGLGGRRPQRALGGVSLAVPAGVAFGLIGPNGAGKTTFIKLLLAVARPTAGTIRVLGGDPEDVAVRARVGYLPERLELPPSSTPLGFLASVARLKRLRPGDVDIPALVRRVGLEAAAGRRIGAFSKGMRQRLGLAAALLGAPELLVLDEPTDGVDPMGRVEIRAMLEAELARGATVFLNSHLLSETERLCGRIGILSGGRLVREGPIDELCRVEGRWSVRFAPGAPAEALVAAGFDPPAPGAAGEAASNGAAGAWRFVGSDVERLNTAIDRARAAGARLIELRAEQRDLEDVLAETLEAPAP